MKVSRSTSYAILAVTFIAKNKDKLTLSKQISEQYNIPIEYLLKVMLQLTKSGILKSKRGSQGGFSLGRPADKISLLEIIESIDGAMVNGLYLSEVAPNEKYLSKIEKAYEKGIEQAKAVYEKMKLSEMI